MKMICNKSWTCKHVVCPGLVPHEKNDECDTHVCGGCVPVRPKRKPGTVWVVYKDHQRMHADENHGEVYHTRNIARQAADELRADGFEVRGPVKVVLP